MRRACLTLALIGVAFFTLTAALRAEAQSAPATANDHILRTAVVRVGYIYHNMQESAQSFQNLKTRFTEMQQEQARKGQEIDGLVNQLQQLKPGSPQWVTLRDSIDDKKLALESWGKKMQLELDRQKKKELMNQYQHVNEAVDAVAKQLNLDLIISDSTPEITGPDLDGIPYQQLEQLLAARAVLFAGKKTDVTQEVLTLVDANFAKQKQAVGAAPSGNAVPVPGH
jgi:Skp family chaperone for outer membrane proteins